MPLGRPTLKGARVKVFEAGPEVSKEFPDFVLVFGSGLIGRPVGAFLHSVGYQESELPFCWGLGSEFAKVESRRLFELVESFLRRREEEGGCLCRIAIVWAAGRCGFSSSESEIEVEKTDFEAIASQVNELATHRFGLSLVFHYISSAGALFEGHRLVTESTVPAPIRPYGRLKLLQEEFISEELRVASVIYRPSSIFGSIQNSTRRNLIGNLVRCATKGEVCQISGSLSTLRDYVHADDVGRFVGREVLCGAENGGGQIHLMASFKPSSIYEIRRLVESITKRRVFLRLDPEPNNSQDITFAPPRQSNPRWNPRDLGVGIRSVSAAWVAGL
jgi:UDP-glucose 4-epimerase